MPSVHVGWALIVAFAVITVSRSRWRWLAAGYPLLTTLAVVVTANHFWLDGIAAAALVVMVLAAQRLARRLVPRLVPRLARRLVPRLAGSERAAADGETPGTGPSPGAGPARGRTPVPS